MKSQIYLVLIRDGRLALTVGAALEDRLLRDGHRAIALVPAARGPEFAGSDRRRHLAIWGSGPASAGHGPQVVALYEEGLLDDLASLGLPAYVGVRHDEEARVARWADGSGAIMLPVATARDLVDAVAGHAPWSKHAGELPSARYPVAGAKAMPMLRRYRQSGNGGSSAKSGNGGSPARSRRAATAATVAGPLLLASLPATGIALSGPSQVPTLATAPSGGSLVAVDTAYVQSAPPAITAPAPANPAPSSGFFSNLFTRMGEAQLK